MQNKTLMKCILLPLLTGAVSGFLTRNGMREFMQMPQPALSPPSWAFPIVWTILYVMMGIASYEILLSETTEKVSALSVYGTQLIFNFCWSLIFFCLKNYLLAFVWLIAMWGLILAATVKFWKIHRQAALLMVPYLLWTTFAAYLNFGVYAMNR